MMLRDLICLQEMTTDPSKQVKLGFVCGLVPREKSMAFEMILFRATRGNVFFKQAVVEDPVSDPVSGEKVITEVTFMKCQLLSSFLIVSSLCFSFLLMLSRLSVICVTSFFNKRQKLMRDPNNLLLSFEV